MTVRGRVANVFLAAASLGVCLAVSEGIGCLLERSRPARPKAAYITDWAVWEGDFYTVRSTAAGWPPWEDYNHDGLRDRTHAVEKPAGVRRVVCIGDSTTLGWGIRPEEAYPQVLQDLLDSTAARAEVFNVALGGWSTRQELIAYRRLARKYHPDRVLLGVCLNDLPELNNNLRRPPALVSALFERSALVRVLVHAQDREIRDVEELFERPDSAKVREAFRLFFADLVALRDEVHADGGQLSVLLFPFRLQVAPGAPAATPQATIAAFCARQGIPTLDLLPSLRAVGDPAFIDYDHFSPHGAREVAEQVLASGLLGDEGAAPPAKRSAPSGSSRGLDLSALEAEARSDDPSVRAAAARALGNLGPAAGPAVPVLSGLLADQVLSVRAAAAWALGSLGSLSAPATPALEAELASLDPSARAGAAWALGRIGEAAAPAAGRLATRLRDEDPSVRWRASEALSRVKPEPAAVRAALLSALGAPDSPGRAEAAMALGRLGEAVPDAVPALTAALRDRNPDVRWRAAWALGQIGPAASSAVPELVRAMGDAEIRWRVADALGGIGSGAASAVPALAQALKDESSNVRWRAAKALGRIGPAALPAFPALVATLRDPQENVRMGAFHALAHLPAEPAVLKPVLVKGLKDPDSRVRHDAADALGRLGSVGREALPALHAAEADEDETVREAAAHAVRRLARR